MPYPEDADAPDGPTQIKALAEALDQLPTKLIEDLAVTTAKVAALAITEGKLAANSVATAKIVDLAVTTAKLAALAVTEEKLAGEAVSAAKIKALAVTAAKLAAEAVETGKIANLAVTAAKLAASAVEEAKIKDGAVTSRKLKLTGGIVDASENLALEEAYADVPGTEKAITPAVASILKVTAVFAKTTGTTNTAVGTLAVDGVEQTITAVAGSGAATTATQVYRVTLTAAEHKVKLRAKRGSGPGTLQAAGTRYLYELEAS